MTPFERYLSKLSVKLFPLTEVIAAERVRKLHGCMCLSEDPILDSDKTIQCTQENFQRVLLPDQAINV